MDNLIGFQRDLLYVIAGGDQSSGQDVKGEVEKYYSAEINHGRLYPNLDTLVNKELVEKGELDRRTNYYAITDAVRKKSKSGVSGRTSTWMCKLKRIRSYCTFTDFYGFVEEKAYTGRIASSEYAR